MNSIFPDNEDSVLRIGRRKLNPRSSNNSSDTMKGPLLLLLYINDLLDSTSKVRLFVDDCGLCREIAKDTDTVQLQKDPYTLNRWTNPWQMKFSASKRFLFCFTTSRKHITDSYFLHGTKLDHTQNTQILGILLSDDYN